jgi:hypothetical protein
MFKHNQYLKTWLSYLVIIVVFVIIGFLIFVFNQKGDVKKGEVGSVIPINDQIKTDTLPNPFNYLNAKIGDVVSGMEIVKLSAFSGDVAPTLNNLSIKFKNKKLITGRVRYYDSGLLQGKVCIENYDPYEQKSLPRLIGDSRLLFVCFSNVDAAKKIVADSGESELVSVYIDNFVFNINNADAVNTADYVSQ